MLPTAQMAIDVVEALEKSNREFAETLAQIALRNAPNPFDERYDLEMLLDGADDDSGLEPHRR